MPFVARVLHPWGGGADRLGVFSVFAVAFSVIFSFTALPAFSESEYSGYIKPESEYDTIIKNQILTEDVVDKTTTINLGITNNSDTSGTFCIENTLFKNNNIQINIIRNDGSETNYNATINAGLINNTGNIQTLNADFVGNIMETSANFENSGGTWKGGLISNNGKIENLHINAINNVLHTKNEIAYGAATYLGSGKIGNISGNFINNTVQSDNHASRGGAITAIWNAQYNQSINGNFIGNAAIAEKSYAQGGAIALDNGNIGDINGDFVNNSTTCYLSGAGGAIYSYKGKIGNITGIFDGNGVKNIPDISGTRQIFMQGGAIYSSGDIGNVSGSFLNNYVDAYSLDANGGAICFSSSSYIESLSGAFIKNKVYNKLGFAAGGALSIKGNAQINFIESSFLSNSSIAEKNGAFALGGAIYTENSFVLKSDNKDIIFSGNYTQDFRGTLQNAIFVKTNTDEILKNEAGEKIGYNSVDKNVVLSLNATNFGSIKFDDTISGATTFMRYDEKYGIDAWIPNDSLIYGDYTDSDGITHDTRYTLSLTGDSSGEIVFNNDIINAKIVQNDVTTTISSAKYLTRPENQGRNSLTVNSGTFNILNVGLTDINFKELALNGGEINLSGVKADLKNGVSGKISADTESVGSATVNITDLTLTSDANSQISVPKFAPEGTNVVYSGKNILYAPIFKYSASANDGNLTLLRGAGFAQSDYRAFNPAILASSAAVQGVYTNQLEMFNIAMSSIDSFMMLPQKQRISLKYKNKYTANPDNGVFSPIYSASDDAFWVKTYASFENIPLHNGPKVGNINYGTVVGHDSELAHIKYGFERVITPYIAYTGNSQRFSGINTTQNGGVLGGTVVLYKDNFFNATTLSIGASSGNSSTMYGSESFTMLSAGVGNKTGYNFEFKNGKFIIQPALLLSYNFINTFDYNNAAGVRIESDPLNAIQVAPGVKFIANTKNGWQPYLAVNMVWNILDKTKFTAAETRLPQMSIKPYVEYGLGVQKVFKNDNFTAYAQTMLRSAGRSGVSLSAGLRWNVGRGR